MSTAALNTARFTGAGLSGAPRSAPQPRLRMTKRGRRVLMFLIALPLVLAAASFALNGGVATATDTVASSSLQYVTVHAGQSLWQLAGEIAPSSDPREVVSDIVHLNRLSGADIQVGQRIAIPAQYSH